MRGDHHMQFRLPKMSRRDLAHGLACCKATRQIAPTFCDWLRDSLADELSHRLERCTSAGKALRGAPIERAFIQVPTLSCSELADALRWCHAAVHNSQNYKLGKLADVLHGHVVASIAARLYALEKSKHVRVA